MVAVEDESDQQVLTFGRWLGRADRPLAGWLSRPAAGMPAAGVFLVPPLMYEYWSCYRTYRALAGNLAFAGIAALRVDLYGTGTSSGDSWEPDQLARWRDSIRAGVKHLRDNGCSWIGLVGVRAGAALALLEGSEIQADAVAAWSPIDSGRRYTRELTLLASRPPEDDPRPEARDVLVSGGIALTSATLTDLKALSLNDFPGRPAPDVLILEAETGSGQKVAATLEELGGNVSHQVIAGASSMLGVSCERAVIPHEAISAVTAWLSELAPQRLSPPRAPDSTSATMSWAGSRITEEITTIGSLNLHAVISFTTSGVGGVDSDLVQTSTDSPGATTTYGYDALDRMTSAAVGSTTYGYTYDVTGNRLSSSVTGASTQYYGYNNADELCWSGTTNGSNGTASCPTTPSGDTGYTYDNEGNQVSGGVSNAYNTKNQTTSTTLGTTTTTFGYSDIGQAERVSSTSGGTTTGMATGLLGLAIAQAGPASPIYFTRDPEGNPISMRVGAGGTSTNSYYLIDQEGSVLRLTDATGNTDTATYSYDPYGVTLTATGTQATLNPYRYAAGYYDSSTGLLKLGQRYESPSLGRFTQLDGFSAGISDPTAVNKYSYVDGNPASESDPSGNLGTVCNGDKCQDLDCHYYHTCESLHFSIGHFLLGIESGVDASFAYATGAYAFGALTALLPETGGLSALGYPLAAGDISGGAALTYVSYRDFREAF